MALDLATLEGRNYGICGDDRPQNLYGGTSHEDVSANAGNASPSVTFTNCRFFQVDADGYVKFDHYNPVTAATETAIMAVKAGVFYPIRFVTSVFSSPVIGVGVFI
jgi:hypothetical protein